MKKTITHFLTLLLFVFISNSSVNAQGTTGTADGNYKLTTTDSVFNSHSTGFQKVYDKLAVNNGARNVFYTTAQGYSLCDGSLLDITSNTPLFALLVTIYGGDGVTNFALPDLRGAVPVGTGKNKASGTKYNLGGAGGAATAQISQDNLPAHTHEATMPPLAATLNINKAIGTKATPDAGDSLAMGNIPSSGRGSVDVAVSMYSTNTPTISLNATSIQVSAPQITVANTGNSKPIDIMQPYIAMNYIIATDGSFPSRPL